MLLDCLHNIICEIVLLLNGSLLLYLLLYIHDPVFYQLLRLILYFLSHLNRHLQRLALGLHLHDLVCYGHEDLVHLVADSLSKPVLPLLLLEFLPLHFRKRAVVHTYLCYLLVNISRIVVKVHVVHHVVLR